MKRIYLDYMIKKPYLFFIFVLIGTGVILFLLLSTKVPVINTYKAEITKNQGRYMLSCEEAIFGTKIETIFLYKDKNEAIYQALDYTVLNENQILLQHIEETNLVFSNEEMDEIFIEVSQRDITLFEKIFIRGGKN